MQNPVADLVFPPVDRGHEGQDDIVQSHGNRRRDLVAPEDPGDRDGKQRFQAPERGEAEKDSDGGTECDRMRRVSNRHQRHVVRSQPPLQSPKRPR